MSESGHAEAMYDLQVFGTIDFQHCAARDQSDSNNDFGREIELLVHGIDENYLFSITTK